VKYAWINQHRDSFPVAVMCDVLNVSPSGYYDSIDREPSDRQKRHERIQQAVEQVHAESYGIYGSQKVAEVLQQREDMESACRNTVAAAMREMVLKSRVCKRFTPTTRQTGAANIRDDLLLLHRLGRRGRVAGAPSQPVVPYRLNQTRCHLRGRRGVRCCAPLVLSHLASPMFATPRRHSDHRDRRPLLTNPSCATIGPNRIECILSITPTFLSNERWTKREFDSIFAREVLRNKKIVVPIWHDGTPMQVFEYTTASR
jgi:hypothetical protein